MFASIEDKIVRYFRPLSCFTASKLFQNNSIFVFDYLTSELQIPTYFKIDWGLIFPNFIDSGTSFFVSYFTKF